MKTLGRILLLGGLVSAACGLYGIYSVSQILETALYGMNIDGMISLTRLLGAYSYLSLQDQFLLFILEERVVMLIGGLIAAAIGYAVKHSEK